jgi:hypothetical protein
MVQIPNCKTDRKNEVSRMHVQMVETNEKIQVIIARRIHEFIEVFQVTKDYTGCGVTGKKVK